MKKKYICIICGYIYDEQLGVPDDNILPNTKWEEVPDDWCCPECDVCKDQFEILY